MRDGDLIRLDVSARRLDVLIEPERLRQPLNGVDPLAVKAARGYGQLYRTSVLQADQGCDFDFMRAAG